MIRRPLTIGFVSGVLLSVAGLYPAVGLIAPLLLPGWQRPVTNELLHSLLLMLSAVIFVPLLFTFGGFAARRTTARCAKDGAKAGALAGTIVGVFVYMNLVAPLSTLAIFRYMAGYHPSPEMELPPIDAVLAYVQGFGNSVHFIDVTIFALVIIGSLSGAWIGWRQRHLPLPVEPSLFELAEGKRPSSTWFSQNETPIKYGLLVGLILGLLIFTTVFGEFYVGFTADWPELMTIMEQYEAGKFITGPVRDALPILWPFIMLGFLIYGGIVVWLVRNPPDLFKSRFRAIMVATQVILLSLFAVLLHNIYFLFGLAPFGLFHWVNTNPAALADMPTDVMPLMQTVFFLQKPVTLLTGVLLLPWLILLVVGILGLLWGALQSFFYIPLVSLLIPRPVDKATRLHRQINREPQQALPQIYALFQYPDAYEILGYLSARIYKTQPDLARLLTAYHTLGSSIQTEEHLRTTEAIQTVLSKHPDWRWAGDMGAVYRALHQVLNARTLEQILRIEPP
ncbi:MAG: hypothetical protein KC415_13495, partial [Anaerolineales bacterium]|nr:hypothetical protein [Anaerolineales bacterium]